MDHVMWRDPFQGQSVIHRLGLAMIDPHTKFGVSMLFTHYEDMKGNAKRRNCDGFGLGVTQGHWQWQYSIECIQLPIQL